MIAALALLGYLLGSIPFGWLLTRAVGIDIRAVGSGNIGSTNVLRTGNKGLAAATLLLDAGKGALAVGLAAWLGGTAGALVAAAAAFVGHCFPVWLGFRGGKGVATLLGLTLMALPAAGVAMLAVWLGGALVTRYSSVGGMLAALAAPVGALLLGQRDWAVILAGLALLLIWQHRDNITRLRDGTESRIGARAA
ncbi:glycerol-3-phosphate acyltransferase [alpha proteobacterium AAP81b]|nr:glycerol-3-phosphate acyltransferase [alpha proteobacterium AAP81b]